MGTRMSTETEWLLALKRVEREGFFTFGEVGENVYTGEPGKGVSWGMIAAEVAKSLPGLTFVSSHGGLSWVNGAGGSKAVLVPFKAWLDMEPGRQAIRDVLGGVHILRMATPGKAASLLLKYAADPEPIGGGGDLLLRGIQWGYHDCKPGDYPHVTQYDVKGYYYSLLERAPSLRVFPHRKGLEWQPLRETEREAWSNVKAMIKDCKILRNSLVGVMAGSRNPHQAYARTKNGSRLVLIKGKHGPFRNLAILIVRTGWEMTRSESLQTQSVYSTIDCVTSLTHSPSVWERFGLTPTVRYKGSASIVGRGIYRIGLFSTKWFDLANRKEFTRESETMPVPVQPGVTRYYTLDWLSPIGGLYGYGL